MMDIVSREQQYFVANRVYATAAELDYTLPPDVAANYTHAISLDAGPPPSFTVNFTATGGQASDGDLSINGLGDKLPADKW